MIRDTPPPPTRRGVGRLLLAALIAAAVVLIWAAGGTARPEAASRAEDRVAVDQDSVATLLRQRLSTPGEFHGFAGALVSTFYRQRDYEPAWSNGGVVSDVAVEMARVLREAEREGLEPEEYSATAIDELLGRVGRARASGRSPQAQDLSGLDLLLTDGFLTYGSHLLRGRVDPRKIHPGWGLSPRSADLVALLGASIRRGSAGVGIQALQSTHPGYPALRRALEQYREIERQGGWAPLPPGPTLRPGERGETVVRLRERLTSEVAVHHGDSARVFDSGLERAVREFQRRHGLREDGVVGPETRTALDVSAARRVSQIELALERLRWLPEDLGAVHVLVRVPAFELEMVEGGRADLKMRIIGGRPDWPTPIFSGEMSTVVLSPYWNIPASIAAQEVVPEARRDPGYLDSNDIRVVSGYGTAERTINPRSIDWARYDAYRSPYRLRQDPGPRNPLGGIKFVFPNPHHVYLHDTPGKHLFAEPGRAFSHGCIRVEKPLELAVALLRRSGWTAERIEDVVAMRVERTIALPEVVPVHILYETVWVDTGGNANFRADLYGHDQRLARARLGPVGELSAVVSGDCELAAAAFGPAP